MREEQRLPLLRPVPDYLRELAGAHGLGSAFQNFVDAARPPSNMQGFLFAVERLLAVFTDPGLPLHWTEMPAFQQWAKLFALFLGQAGPITSACGQQVGDGFLRPVSRRSILEGQMEQYPHLDRK